MPEPEQTHDEAHRSTGPRGYDLTGRLTESRAQDFVGRRDLTHWPSAAGRELVHVALRLGHRLAPTRCWR